MIKYCSKNSKIVFLISFLVVLAGILLFALNDQKQEQVFCTQEAKLCPDGSYVGRTGPDCEFAECPYGFGNGYVEKAIIDYLLTQGRFSWKTREDGRNLCVIENLSEKELFPLYVWAYCIEYAIEDGEVKVLSGSSGPVKIDYPNELSYYDLSRFSYEVPGDGSHYAPDIRAIFPEDLHQKIFTFDRERIIKKAESAALGI